MRQPPKTISNLTFHCSQHAASNEYCFRDYIASPGYIGQVVSFDRPLLGDISDLDVVHLQCHIGTDTLSLARLGAASVVGLDFSPKSLVEANKLATATRGSGGEKLKYVNASVYDALTVLEPATFDLVFTGIGALCWLHSVSEWANIVAALLKPGGRLFLRECHPVLWSLDLDHQGPALKIEFPYFEREEPNIWYDDGTYVKAVDGTPLVFESKPSVEFNHGIGEIIQALLDVGMCITGLKEHDSVPWDAYPGKMKELGNGEYRLIDRPWRVPHTYTLQARKGSK